MGLDRSHVRLGHATYAQDSLDGVAAAMSTSVVEACCADAVLFCFTTDTGETRIVPARTPYNQDELNAQLVQFWERKSRSGRPFAQGGFTRHVSDASAEHFFLLMPLMSEGESLGALAIAIARHKWVEQKAFSACAQIARLVAMNVQAAQTKTRLELDLAELNQRAHHLRRQAELDPLTRVENKMSFDQKVTARFENSTQPAALLAVDLDFFKHVNDTYGHPFGDSYLKIIARTLVNSLPDTAIVGRIGGDEFGILVELPEVGRAYLNGLITRVRGAVQRNVAVLGKPDLGRLSIGVGLFPTQAMDYDRLFAMADAALYASKDADRNTTTMYDSTRHAMAEHGGPLNPRLTDFSAIAPYFQPILNLETQTCTGLEVLARKNPDAPGGADSKNVMWMFQDHRIAPRLTRHILKNALHTLQALHKDNPGSTPDLWFNVTKFDLLDPEFVFDVQTMLDREGLDWSCLVFEVHEEIMLADRKGQTYHSLQELRHRGARVALDDFGTGYAGLTHIREWPVDIIKIDQSFVANIASDPQARVVVEALLMIAGSMNQKVVAEGVETVAQLDCVRALACDFAQGFLFHRALSAERIGPVVHRYNQGGTLPLADFETDLHIPAPSEPQAGNAQAASEVV